MFAGYAGFRSVPRMERFANLWRIPGAFGSLLANLFAALAPLNDQNRKLYALARDGARIVHPYFLSRMLFMPEQRDKLLAARIPNSALHLAWMG